MIIHYRLSGHSEKHKVKNKTGGSGGTRTHDKELKRLLLYQLSYRPTVTKTKHQQTSNNNTNSPVVVTEFDVLVQTHKNHANYHYKAFSEVLANTFLA